MALTSGNSEEPRSPTARSSIDGETDSSDKTLETATGTSRSTRATRDNFSRSSSRRSGSSKPKVDDHGVPDNFDDLEVVRKLRRKNVSPNTRGGVQIWPWDKIRKEFVQGFGDDDHRRHETQVEIAARYGVSLAVLRNRASKENWTAAKQKYMLDQASVRRTKRASVLADYSVEFDLDLFDEAKVLLKIIHARFEEIVNETPLRKRWREDQLRKMDEDPLYKPVGERMYTAVRADELERLANALLRAKEVEAKAVGEADQILQLSGTVEHVSISDQLGQADPDRVASLLRSMYEARLIEVKEGKIVLPQFSRSSMDEDPQVPPQVITQDGEPVT